MSHVVNMLFLAWGRPVQLFTKHELVVLKTNPVHVKDLRTTQTCLLQHCSIQHPMGGFCTSTLSWVYIHILVSLISGCFGSIQGQIHGERASTLGLQN